MALADIDAGATQRRIQEIADGAKKAFEGHAQRSAEIDTAAREAAAKEEADLEAVRERRAGLKAREAAEEAAAHQQEQPKSPARPATLSLGAEEFKLDRQARQAAESSPAVKRPPRPDADDDLSGRSWLR